MRTLPRCVVPSRILRATPPAPDQNKSLARISTSYSITGRKRPGLKTPKAPTARTSAYGAQERLLGSLEALIFFTLYVHPTRAHFLYMPRVRRRQRRSFSLHRAPDARRAHFLYIPPVDSTRQSAEALIFFTHREHPSEPIFFTCHVILWVARTRNTGN